MIEFTDVVKSYTVGTRALKGVSMQIEDGEFAFLVGPSGSGKSTIIKLITGELKPTSGTVHVNGYSLERIRKREIPYLRRTVGVVFQDFRLIENKTVYENVAFVMKAVGASRKKIREDVPRVLELVDGRVPLLVELKGEDLDTSLCTRAAELLRVFGSVKAISRATVEQLLTVRGMTRPAAEAVVRALQQKENENGTDSIG